MPLSSIFEATDDLTRIQIAQERVGLEARRETLAESEFEDQHALSLQQQQLNKLKLGSDLLSLMQQKTEIEAFKLYDPDKPESMGLVARAMAQGGDPKGAMTIIQEMNKERIANIEAGQKAAKTAHEQLGMAADVASNMTDPSSYQSGYQQLVSMGIDPSRFGLTPEPTAQNLAQAKRLSVQGMSSFQKQEIGIRLAAEARQDERDTQRFKIEMARLGQTDKRIALSESRVAIADQREKDYAAHLAAVQAGQEQKEQDSMDKAIQKQGEPLRKHALDAIDSDETLAALPDAQKKLIARQVSAEALIRAKQASKTYDDFFNQRPEKTVEDLVKEASDAQKTKDPGMLASLLKRFGVARDATKAVVGAAKKAAAPASAPSAQPTNKPAPTPSKYTIGQIIVHGGKKYKVTGLSDPNNPDIEPVK